MNQEDSLIPPGWFFPSERVAVHFYGDALLAHVLEERPPSDLYRSICDQIGRSQLMADAFGLVPDLAAARTMLGLTRDDIAQLLEVSESIIADWECVRRPLPSTDAIRLCRSMLVPFAILFRSRSGWHPLTVAGMSIDGEELPF